MKISRYVGLCLCLIAGGCDANPETMTEDASTADANDPIPDAAVDTCQAAPTLMADRVYPSMAVRPEHREMLRARVDMAPYADIMTLIRERAAREWEEPEEGTWESRLWGTNGTTAQAAAFLAWLEDDEMMAAKAREFLANLETNYDDNRDFDINIRMPYPLMGFTNAWDLLRGTSYFPPMEAQAARDKILQITGQFYDQFMGNELYRQAALVITQNNHPIRTAAAIGYVALAFPDHPQSQTWLNYAISDLDYLWGANGQYVQPDGGVSEGPFYFDFALSAATAFFVAWEHVGSPEACLRRVCTNRVDDTEPWRGHGCVEGEIFSYASPLRDPLLWSAAEWSLSLRMPNNLRVPLADSRMTGIHGAALFPHFGANTALRWDWNTLPERERRPTWGADLTIPHLVYIDEMDATSEPDWSTRFFESTGHAILRSGWGQDALFGFLIAESGAARLTLHDHGDGTAFVIAAHGEMLLMDTGYYKPNDLALPLTAQAPSHNVILIDGQAAPPRGTLHNFGDADAFLRNTMDGRVFDYAEAWQDYQETHFERAMVLVRNRYFVIADALTTTATAARQHQWRMHPHVDIANGEDISVVTDGIDFQRNAVGTHIRVATTAGAPDFIAPPYEMLQAPHVHSIGQLGDHVVYDATVMGVAPQFLAIIDPYRLDGSADAALNVTLVTQGDGLAAWRVQGNDIDDLILLRDSTGASSLSVTVGMDERRVETDGRLAIVGLNDGARLLARGSSISVDGVARAIAAADGVVEAP